MKKYTYLSLVFLVAVLISCKPETTEIGQYYPAGDGLVGSWQLDNVTLSDLSLPVPEDDDPTDFYKNHPTQWKFTFQSDSTYTVDEKGPGPDLFGESGTWHFTEYPFPTGLIFYSANDTLVTALENMPRETDQHVGFSFKRNGCDADYIQYTYKFNRITK